jgi:hypothetical protein
MLYEDAGLVTLDSVKAQLKLNQVADADDDELVQQFIYEATGLVTQITGRIFTPYRETRTYDARGPHLGYRDSDPLPRLMADSCQTLNLGGDLLECITLTNGDNAVIASSQYALRPNRVYPKYMVELLPSASTMFTYVSDWQDAISVDAIWGYHEDYGRAWVDTLEDVPDLDASTMTINVSDVAGRDARYRVRFEVGDILRIEDEYLKVVVVTADDEQDTITVLRGQFGTTAAAHEAGVSIERFAVMRDIELACRALVVWLYRNKATQGDEIQFMGDDTKVVSGKIPSNVAQTLERYAWRPIG